jgi:Flp pilus assembly protein TadD
MATACAILLAGCTTSTKLGDIFHGHSESADATGSTETGPAGDALASAEPDTTGTVGATPPFTAADPELLGTDPKDDLSLGKKQYRAGNYGLAESYFRRATELHPRDAEAWVGLAAAYDRLRRFDLADRAYDQAVKIIGPTAELLNNRGFSYMLRGDYRRARETLLAAAARDPGNPYVKNNLDLLDKSFRNGKAVQ